MQPGALGGTMAYIGKPLEAVARAAMPGTAGASNSFAGRSDDRGDTMVEEGKLPETMSGFLAGGYLEGDSAPMPTARPLGGRDQFDGWFLAGGIEVELGDAGALGFALSYTDIDGQSVIPSQAAGAQLYQGTMYLKANLGGPVVLDGVGSVGMLSSKTSRTATIGASSYVLTGQDDALTVSSEVGLSAMFGDSVQFGPRIAARASYIGFSQISETGGPAALNIDRTSAKSFQGRAGLELRGTGRIRPFGSAAFVHDFEDRPALFGANFVGGTGPNAGFALSGTDHDWFEVSGGLALDTGSFEISVSADTTIDRDDVKNQSYRGSIKFRF
jgi:hypothetical protein